MDAAPFIENGRTYVPVRYLALALGVAEKDIGWDAKTQTVTLVMGERAVSLKIGSAFITVEGGVYANSAAKQMDVAPVIKKGRTYLPARWVAEAFGYAVSWDPGTKTMLVYPPEQEPQPDPTPATGSTWLRPGTGRFSRLRERWPLLTSGAFRPRR
ncbi:MAG: copper amine oxidase N-terminal domain-containing protein [Bacillota bacterium]